MILRRLNTGLSQSSQHIPSSLFDQVTGLRWPYWCHSSILRWLLPTIVNSFSGASSLTTGTTRSRRSLAPYCLTSSTFLLACSLPLYQYPKNTLQASCTIFISVLTSTMPCFTRPSCLFVLLYSSSHVPFTYVYGDKAYSLSLGVSSLTMGR